MRTRYCFRTLPLEWRDCDAWPAVAVDLLTEEDRDRFERLERGLRHYLKTGALRAAAKEALVSPPVLLDQLNRCVAIQDNGQLTGWLGLVAHARIRGYVRKKAASNGPAGLAGAFSQFLRSRSDLRDVLNALIRKGGVLGNAESKKPSATSVFRSFRKYCISKGGIAEQDYPFATKSGGRRSVLRYVAAFIKSDAKSSRLWHGSDAQAGRLLGTGTTTFPWSASPLDSVGADAHKIHCHGVVMVNGPKGLQPVPIKRIWIFVALDEDSHAVLGYSAAIRAEISAANVEQAFAACSESWSPKELTIKGLSYLPGAGLPTGVISGLAECRPCVVRLDNAVQHLSNRVAQAARMAWGCALTYGPVGAWWRNGLTERLFRTLSVYGFQQLPSSTGSNTTDPLRCEPIRAATRNHITSDALLELIDVLLANYNITPQTPLGSQSPLAVLQDRLERGVFLPRPAPQVAAHAPRLGVSVEVRFVRGCAQPGRIRSPYVEIDKATYSSPTLSGRFDLIGAQVIVHIPEGDMRTVTAFELGGTALGELVVLNKGWAASKHSREMRKVINSLIDAGVIAPHASDITLSYIEGLRAKAVEDATSRPLHVSVAATKLADALRQTGTSVTALTEDSRQLLPAPQLRPLPPHTKAPRWVKS